MALRPGVNHIEFWVKDMSESLRFYSKIFKIIGWRKINKTAFSSGYLEIYFIEKITSGKKDSLGPRHICFQATSRKMVNEVHDSIKPLKIKIIRGPIEVDRYSKGYYTLDFFDPNGFVIEVAYTPNMVL